MLGEIAGTLSEIKEIYERTTEFMAQKIWDVFWNKTVNYSDTHNGGAEISPNDSSVNSKWMVDLTTENWFVYTDNYGTVWGKGFCDEF